MAVSLAGMRLHTNNDNEGNWSGTDGADAYNVAVQSVNSESWLVSKNASETGTLTLSSDISGTDNLFMMWMKSDLSFYYTSVKLELQSSSGNYRSYTLATSSLPAVDGAFRPFVVDVNNGGTPTGTFVPANFSVLRVIVDNSASGNIRSVINNWIDAMYYGSGFTVSGTTANDALFAEATAIDENNSSNKYGILENYSGQIFSQGNLRLAGTSMISKNESLTFKDTLNGISAYKMTVTGTLTLENTLIAAEGTANFAFSATGANAFNMTGGGLTRASQIDLTSGQVISGANFVESGYMDTNGATVTNCKFINTNEPTYGALLVNLEAESDKCTDLQFDGYENNGSYAVYVASAVTTFTMDNWFFSDPDNTTSFALYWAGSAGILTINSQNGTNISATGCTSAGGTFDVVSNPVTTQVNVKAIVGRTNIQGARVYLICDSGGPLTQGTVIFNELTDASGNVSDTRSLASDQPVSGWVRKASGNPPYYKTYEISGTIDSSSGVTFNVLLIQD
jgi:hypothetical protein